MPPNCWFDQNTKHYKYRRRDNGRCYSLGKDKAKALNAAKQLNSLLMEDQDLVAKVMGTTHTLKHYIETRFIPEHLQNRMLSHKTLHEHNLKLKVLTTSSICNLCLDDITVRGIADFLNQFPPTQANRYRSLLNLIFRYALSEGLVSTNPVKATLNRKLIKSRQRLSIQAFNDIYSFADPWLKNAMDIGLLTLQRREDILKMKFSDIKEGFLYVVQHKTAKHGKAAFLKIKIGKRLNSVIERCRDDIVSPFLVHRLPDRLIKRSVEHHTQVMPDYLSKAFTKARDSTNLFDDVDPKVKPTFHEIRSLGITLYEDAGIDAQTLAGHANRLMTDKYKQGHDIVWTETEACLNF